MPSELIATLKILHILDQLRATCMYRLRCPWTLKRGQIAASEATMNKYSIPRLYHACDNDGRSCLALLAWSRPYSS